jgi:hypothetical protein
MGIRIERRVIAGILSDSAPACVGKETGLRKKEMHERIDHEPREGM